MRSGVYTITNLVNKKVYVGYALEFNERRGDHFRKLRQKVHKNKHLQSSYDMYGERAFLFEILIECELEFLCSEEHYWCNLLQSHNPKFGYNQRPTNPYGIARHKKETLVKIADSRRKLAQERGYWFTPEQIQKRVKSREGYRHSDSIRSKMSEAALKRGPQASPSRQTRLKISAANKGRIKSDKFRRVHSEIRKKPIFMQNEYIVVSFPSVLDAARYITLNSGKSLVLKRVASRISAVLTGKFERYKGFVFKYEVE